MISRQGQEEMEMAFTFAEHTESPNAISRHVEVETHLKMKKVFI